MKSLFLIFVGLTFAFALPLSAQTVGQPFVDPSATTLSRPAGGSLLLRIIETHLQAIFLDKEGKVIAPPFDTASVRYVFNNGKSNNKRFTIQLTPDSSGAFLTADRTITPPNIWVWVSLGGVDDSGVAPADDSTDAQDGLTPANNSKESYSHVHVQQ